MVRKARRVRRKKGSQAPKKTGEYSKNKKAFDQTMSRYRETLDVVIKGSTPEAVEATSAVCDFRCDVETIVEKYIKGISVEAFYETYVEGLGSEDFNSSGMSYIEREVYVQKRLGDRRHRAEQHLGKAFIKLKLWRPGRERAEVREQEMDQAHVHPVSE
jgi:hypothetical protein